jgi:hypothetical protein
MPNATTYSHQLTKLKLDAIISANYNGNLMFDGLFKLGTGPSGYTSNFIDGSSNYLSNGTPVSIGTNSSSDQLVYLCSTDGIHLYANGLTGYGLPTNINLKLNITNSKYRY